MHGPNTTALCGTEMPFETDLCNLLQTMRIESPTRDTTRYVSSVLAARSSLAGVVGKQDDPMDEVSYHSDGGSEYSSSSSSTNARNVQGTSNFTIAPTQDEICGCAYLQTIREQFDYNYNNSAATSVTACAGDYLDAIFTHREILYTFPAAHRDCARAFSDLAFLMERRAWMANQNAETDAVTAFRHEAWMIASTFAPSVPPPVPGELIGQPGPRFHPSCVMPPMY